MQDNDQQYDVIFTTGVATIGLQFNGERLTKLSYLKAELVKAARNKHADLVKNKIIKYLAKESKLKQLDIDVSLDVTDFQRSVLKQLQKIPYGETRTYGDIAKILGTSPRAVGNACRKNPVPIVIPCHRVVAAKGIGGYVGAVSGDKLDIKSWLLKLEHAIQGTSE
jgi:methylated-DNA-[protein]-cysteine S-methyltransferase